MNSQRFNFFILTIIALVFLTILMSCIKFSTSEKTPHTPTVVQLYTQEPPPAIEYFIANPSEIIIGESVELSWKVTGSSKVSIGPDIGNVPHSAGSITVFPQQRTIFTLKVTNSGGTAEASVTIVVNANVKAKTIALSIEEMEGDGFKFITNSEPSFKNTISTYYIRFERTSNKPQVLDNTIYIFKTIKEAEEVFNKEKEDNKMFVSNYMNIGTQGYYLMIPANNPAEDPYISLRFQKNNVYIKLTTDIPFNEMESYARRIESRIK